MQFVDRWEFGSSVIWSLHPILDDIPIVNGHLNSLSDILKEGFGRTKLAVN